jgi:hypothetical protein
MNDYNYGPDIDEKEARRKERVRDAAPELLEACERMGEYLKQHGGPETQGIACDIFQAIAKAKGE